MSKSQYYVDVVFKSPLNQSFTYRSTENCLYRRVLCSFGVSAKRQLVGLVIGVSQHYSGEYELKDILEILDEEPVITLREHEIALWISQYYFSSLGEAMSLYVPLTNVVYSKYKSKSISRNKKNVILNGEQEKAFKKIIESDDRLYLLMGITGSGKTHVYIKLIEYYCSIGKQTLLLLPEITLTPQMEKMLLEYLGDIEVVVLHSKVSAKKKMEYFDGFRRGEIKVIIGTRSALFSVPQDIGLIIMDEEHEDTFKNDTTPRYHVRQVAQRIIKDYGAKLLLGSATPSMEVYHQTLSAKITLLRLDGRYHGATLPQSFIVDKLFDSQEIVSDEVIKKIEQTLAEKKKSIIYINRRGYSSGVRCDDCGDVLMCSNCNISMTYHKKKNAYLCHYCGKTQKLGLPCGKCGSSKVDMSGAGVEKVIQELEKRVKGASILRMDRDELTTDKQIRKALDDVRTEKYNMIVGTQMLSKGHDFPDVQRVFVLYPENELTLSDFRASQRTFNQITQISGRAGRRDEQGEIYIQTQMADHYSIALGVLQDYEKFYNEEAERRLLFGYPPYSRLFRLVIRGKDEREVTQCSQDIRRYFNSIQNESFEILGPSVCLFSKIKNNHRWNLLFKVHRDFHLFLNLMTDFKSNFQYKAGKVYIEYDMDPNEIL